MNDILTPRERFGLLVIDEKPDRCNVIPLITSHAAKVAGIELKRYYTNGEAMARAQITAIEEYGHDAISIFSEVGIVAEAMGSEFIYPVDDLPLLKTPALTKRHIEELKIPQSRKDGRLPVYLEAIDLAFRVIGDTVPILAYVPAPFTTGMMLSEPNRFLVDTIKNPTQVKAVMQKALKATIEFCGTIIDAGGLPIIVDPLASSSIVSPRTYKDFALPYEREMIKFLHRYDFDVILHICGDTTPILDLLLETGADLISIDHVDLSLAINKLSGRMRIIGNFDTTKMVLSSPEEIGKEVSTMTVSAKFARMGYVVSTGCEVPIHSPVENVKAFVRAAQMAGRYWS